MTDKKLKRANDINNIIKDINNLCNKFEKLRNGVLDCIEFPYDFMHDDDLKRGLFEAGINYLKEQLEKYKKEFEEL